MATIIEFLKKERIARNADEIKRGTIGNIDITTNPALAGHLTRNPRVVAYDNGTYAYCAVYPDVCERKNLETLLRSRLGGVLLDDIKDAYPTVEQDIEELIENELIWKITNTETKQDVLYWHDKSLDVEIDERLRKMWHEIKMPTTDGIFAAELVSRGLAKEEKKGVVTSLRSKRPAASRKRRRVKVTNTHLLGTGLDFLDKMTK